MRTSFRVPRLLVPVLLCAPLHAGAIDKCLTGASALGDTKAVAAMRGTINAQCPCASFDGLLPTTNHGAYRKCAKAIVKDATDGTALANGYSLRTQCKGVVTKIVGGSTCGYLAADDRVACCEHAIASGKNKAKVRKAAKCVDTPAKLLTRCYATPFASDACSGDATNSCRQKVVQATVDLPSVAQPANTPGSPSVPPTVDPRFIAQFGSASFSLNNARYTRYRLAGPVVQPDAILVLVPGFEGGAGDFKVLAETLIAKAQAAGSILELWGVDRRTNQLEDLAGLDLAEDYADPLLALDWMFGSELGLPLGPVLAAGPNRRANFYNANADTAFMASWTNLVFSQDIDTIVQAARAVAANQNVFLGGHSAGTGFAARYAATDFDLGAGVDPGYGRVRGLVLLEGGGASVPSIPLTADSVDRIIAKFDGGLYGAVRDGAPRCVDGTTPCTIATEAVDCSAQVPAKCTPTAFAYSVVPGLLNPRILATGELAGIQAITDPDTGKLVVQADQNSVGNNAVAQVADLATLAILPQSTALAGLGNFIDDDGTVAAIATFVSTSVGGAGPVVGGVQTWQDISEGPLPPGILPNNGPAPVTLPGTIWGNEKEPSRIQRVAETNYVGKTNFTDWYYPNAGPGVTSAPGLCVASVCVAGNVGAACASDAACNQSVGLDSSVLSAVRPDIENLTQAANINIPVIGFGGSNGLAPVPGRFLGFANSVGLCTAPSCTGVTPRVVDPLLPNPAFPTLGDVSGGFEVHISEGYGHVDVLTAEDDVTNNVLTPLLLFLQRNTL